MSCTSLCSVTFESGSKLARIEATTFYECSSLKSICLPASVESVGNLSVSPCASLSLFTFESGSKLTRIETRALYGCPLLKSICLPASLQMLDGSALARTGISRITLEEGHRHFRISGNFLLDFDGISVIRYFGSDRKVTLSNNITALNTGCFHSCGFLCSLIFESGSKLARIGDHALSHCSSLTSICLPASVESLGERSFLLCEWLSSLTFESGSKLSRIDSHAFCHCSSLRTISIPCSIKELETGWTKGSSLDQILYI
jgi:hypothetical protein